MRLSTPRSTLLSCVNSTRVTHLLARSHTRWLHPGCWAAVPHWPAACVFFEYQGTQSETTAAWAWWTAARLQQTWCCCTLSELLLLALCPRPSPESLWSGPDNKNVECVFIEELLFSSSFTFDYWQPVTEGRSEARWIIRGKSPISGGCERSWIDLTLKRCNLFEKSIQRSIFHR